MIAPERYTPVTGPLGTQVVALGGPALLSTLCTIPPGAYAAWIRAGGAFTFRLDGVTAGTEGLTSNELDLSNVNSLNACVLFAASGGATEATVQFFYSPSV